MGVLFRALVGAHFHLAELRAGDPRRRHRGYQAWGARLDKVRSGRCRILEHVPPIEETVRILADPPGKEPRDTHRWRQATVVLAQAHHLSRQTKIKNVPALTKHVERSFHATQLRDITPSMSDAAALSRAYGALSKYGGPLPPIRVTTATVDEFGVTRVAAEVEHDTPRLKHSKVGPDTIDKVAQEADPRGWSTNFPQAFAKSYCINPASECIDRYEDPDPYADGKPPPGSSWNGLLFETAQFTLGGPPLAVFRNVLDVDFRVQKIADYNGQIDITYCLHEALSNSALNFGSAGGLDVDSAQSGQCRVTLSGNAKSTHVKTRAAKSLRFSDDAEFSEELNLMCLPFLEAWISDVLLNSVKL
jgi:hypothetical protein